MITPFERVFLYPSTAKHRQYEALRACFVEKLPPSQAAPRFGYSPGSLRVMCSKFRSAPSLAFFFPSPERSLGAAKPQPARCSCARKSWRCASRTSQYTTSRRLWPMMPRP